MLASSSSRPVICMGAVGRGAGAEDDEDEDDADVEA